MRKKRRVYNDEFRASACLMLEAAGYPDQPGALMQVAANVQVPPRTLSRWFRGENNPPPAKIVIEKRFSLIDAIRSELQAIVGRLPDEREGADYRALMTAFGILVDKLQLLENKPTAIIAHMPHVAETIDAMQQAGMAIFSLRTSRARVSSRWRGRKR